MDEIAWPPCDTCGRSVRKASGRLLLREVDVIEHLERRINENSIGDGPTIPWHWGHEECLPDSRYMIVAGNFENMRTLLNWTFRPLEDELIALTNWPETFRRLARATAA